MTLVSDLKNLTTGPVLSTREELTPYTRDASYITGDQPQAVVLPGTTSEVSQIMRYCFENDIQVTVRGGGTSLTGSSVLKGNGIVMSTLRLNKIVETSIADGYVISEPGVRLDDLDAYLSKYNYFYPPDPASSLAATVGGSIATDAGGLRGVMYGKTKNWVLGLEVVLPNGKTMEFGGRAMKMSSGYKLASLIVGSEGTLAVVTKAILKIWPRPEAVSKIVVFFSSISDAGAAITEMKQNGIIPYSAEFADRMSMDLMQEMSRLEYPEPAKYMLMIDLATAKEAIGRYVQLTVNILKKFKPVGLSIVTDPSEMDRLVASRKALYGAILKRRESGTETAAVGDISVPVSQLPNVLTEAEEAIEKHRVKATLMGHIGDGNIHAIVYMDLANQTKMNAVNDFQMSLGKIAVKHGGSVSAEHGIGLEKKDWLLEELKSKNSLETVELFRGLKNTFDTKNILNREKIFD